MAPTVPLVRGTALLVTKAFLEERQGKEAYEKVLARISPQHAVAIRGIALAHEWYPAEAVNAFTDAAAALFGAEYYDEIGAFNAEYDLKFIHRFLLKFTSPLWLMDRGAKIWSEYNNTGSWKIEAGPTPRSLVGTLSDYGLLNRGQCRILVGFIRRAGQLTGAKNMKVEHPQCRSDGARTCVFTATW